MSEGKNGRKLIIPTAVIVFAAKTAQYVRFHFVEV